AACARRTHDSRAARGDPCARLEAGRRSVPLFERSAVAGVADGGHRGARPFPRIQNKSLNFIVRLQGKDAFGRNSELAIVQAPRSLPRVVPVPREGTGRSLVLLSTIVNAFVYK